MHIFIICDFENMYNKCDYLVFISRISFLLHRNLIFMYVSMIYP
jgi:hypothetical protein